MEQQKRARPFPLLFLFWSLPAIAAFWWWYPAVPRARWPLAYSRIFHLQVSADSSTLLALHDGGFSLVDVESARERARLVLDWSHASVIISSLWLSGDGQKVAFNEPALDGTGAVIARLWHPAVQQKSFRLPGMSVAGFTADSRWLHLFRQRADEGHSPPVRCDTTTGQFEDVPTPPGIVDTWATPLLPDGRFQLVGKTEDGLRLWTQTPTDDRWDMLRLPDSEQSLQFFPSGRLVAIEIGNHVTLWHADSGRHWADLRGDAGDRVRLPPLDFRAASMDGRFLCTGLERPGAEGAFLAIWDVVEVPPRQLQLYPLGQVLFAREGTWMGYRPQLAPITRNSPAWELWQLEPCRQYCLLVDPPVFAPDGQTLTCKPASPPRVDVLRDWFTRWGLPRGNKALQNAPPVVLLNAAQGAELAAFEDCTCCAYFPNSRALVIGQSDGAIELWDVPPCRPWVVDYGLPILFAGLLLAGSWFAWGAVGPLRRSAMPNESRLC